MIGGTVQAAPGVWCRWSDEATALRLRPGLSNPAALVAGTPGWRWREHQAGWRLLESLLRELAGHALPARIGTTATGKPVLADTPEVGISIAHCHPAVAVAVGLDWQVGVDTELDTGIILAEQGEPEPDRIRKWTVREACVKATGAGLAGRPWQIPVGEADTGRWGDVHWRHLGGESPVPLSVAWRSGHSRRPTPAERGTS